MSEAVRFRRAVLLLLILFVPVRLGAEGSDVAPAEIWPQLVSSLRSGDIKTATARLRELRVSGISLGLRAFPMYADSTASYAMEIAPRNGQLADFAIDTARQLDSTLPDVEFAAARISANNGRWTDSLASVASGFFKIAKNYRARILARADLLVTLCLAISLGTLLLAVLLFYRYYPPLLHDLRELLANRFRPPPASVISWALVFAPLFLWLGPSWIVLYWLAIFFAYASVSEKVLIAVLLILASITPLGLAWSAYRMAGVDSPVIQAAAADIEGSYNPVAIRRLRELSDAVPKEPVILTLLGNLERQRANERAAALFYRQAIGVNNKFYGAHLNLGNLYFLENDFLTANLEYERAAQADPTSPDPYYNHSVASGELYKFDEQGQQLELAKQRNRARVESLIAEAPRQKIVDYQVPLGLAWQVAERIAKSGQAREIYGNHAVFAPERAIRNPISIGSLLALIAGFTIWMIRRTDGTAGQCIKCGRTFCHRCKAASDSPSYCTQCIHIYLRRSGVPIETKREKLEEVQAFQSGMLRRRRFLSIVLPGSGQFMRGDALRGFVTLLAFIFLVSLAILVGRLAPLAAPATMMKAALRTAALVPAAILWIVNIVSAYREDLSL